jgi:hypothetical protein
MTVADLIARLQELPGDLPVVTPGFDEGGYETISLSIIPLVKRFGGHGLPSPHRFDNPHRFDPPADVFPALEINFGGDYESCKWTMADLLADLKYITGNRAETLSDAPGKGDE